MAFDPLKEGATKVFDPITEGATVIEELPIKKPLEPQEAFDRAGKVWDFSVDLEIPLFVADDYYNEIAEIPDPDDVSKPEELQDKQPLEFKTAPEEKSLLKSIYGYEGLAKPEHYWTMHPVKRAAFDAYMLGRHILTRIGGKVVTEIGVANTKEVNDLYNDELINNPKWYQKSPEFLGWAAEKTAEFYALKGIFKATGLSNVLSHAGQWLAKPFVTTTITARGGAQTLSLLSKEGLKQLGKDSLASFLRFAPENTAFLTTWSVAGAALKDEDKTEAAWAGALWGIGLSALTPVAGGTGRIFLETKAGATLRSVMSRAYTELWRKFPRLMNAGRKPFSQEFQAEAERQFKARFGVDPTAADKAKIKKITRLVGDEITKRAKEEAAMNAYWNSGAKKARDVVKETTEIAKKAIVKPTKTPARPVTPAKPAKGKVFYHGTSKEGLKGILEKGVIPETPHPILKRAGRGFFVSRDAEKASRFGEQIAQITLKPDAKIATPENLRGEFYTEWVDEGKLFNVADVIKVAKEQGFDVVDLQAFHNLTKEPASELAILNPNAIESVEAPGRIQPEKPPSKIKPEAIIEKDILGGVDPLQTIHQALKEAKTVQPLTKAQKAKELRRRVGAATGAMKSNVKKGVPTEEAIFKSTGLLKGPLTEYDQLYTSIEDIIEPAAKESAYAKIYSHPGLQYFEVLNTATSFKKLLAGAALTPTDVKNIENVFGKAFEDITKTRLVRSDLYDRVITIWKAGLLTGIKTSGLNTLANISHAMSETAKDIPAALIDKISSLFTGRRELAFTVRGASKGIIEGVKRGWNYLRTGYDERNIGAKLDYKTVHFGNSKVAKSLQIYEETIFHLLGAEDQPFYYGAKARSLFSQAIAQAKNKGLKGKERDAFVENLIKNPTDEILIVSVHDAEVAVFQNKTTLGDVAKAVQKVKGGEIVIPFGRTPSAVAMQIINYSPIGVVKEIAHQINAGEFNQRKFSQAFGRATIGTAALFVGGLLLHKGLMSLDYPSTEKERELWKLEGRKANSIKIDGKWRSAYVLGPVGNALLIGGYFAKALKEEGSPTKAIVTALSGGAKSFSEQTFVRGVNMLIDALVSPERSFENWFTSMAGSAVPTIIADIARAADEQERRTVGPKERIQSRIPIWRRGLEPRIDVFGQDLPRYGGNVLETMIDPSRPSKIRQDIVVDELRRLFNAGIKVSPTLLGDKKGYDVLTPEENTRLWRRAGELTYKSLLALINSNGYSKADNDFAKGKLIELVIRKTKEAAKMELVSIKLKQGTTIMELAESGLLTIEGLEILKYFGGLEERNEK